MMASEFYKITASCPGSLMIMGEHAVLAGSPAIVAAINKYLTIELIAESRVEVNNRYLSNITIITSTSTNNSTENNSEKIRYTSSLDNLTENKFLKYILAVINYFKQELLNLNYNYKFNISSEINPTMGLGSSAAVTVAAIGVILKFIKSVKSEKLDNSEILAIGYKIINQVQGRGSGADLAASVYGGVIYYKVLDHQVERLAGFLPLKVLYSGYKLSTSEVVKIVENSHTAIYEDIFAIIAQLVDLAIIYIKSQDWQELGKLFNIHYGMQEALGVSDRTLAELVYLLRNQENIYGAKISGSGLGDCVIGLGGINTGDKFHSKYLDIQTTKIGLTII